MKHESTLTAEGEVHVVQVGEDRRQYDDVMGELFISPRDARKRFTQFLRTETRCLGSDEPYSAQLMRQKGQNRVLDVNLQDVKNYDDVLGQLVEEQPNTYLPVVRGSGLNSHTDRMTVAHLCETRF